MSTFGELIRQTTHTLPGEEPGGRTGFPNRDML